MQYFEQNPATLLLANPPRPRRRPKATTKAVGRKPAPKATPKATTKAPSPKAIALEVKKQVRAALTEQKAKTEAKSKRRKEEESMPRKPSRRTASMSRARAPMTRRARRNPEETQGPMSVEQMRAQLKQLQALLKQAKPATKVSEKWAGYLPELGPLKGVTTWEELRAVYNNKLGDARKDAGALRKVERGKLKAARALEREAAAAKKLTGAAKVLGMSPTEALRKYGSQADVRAVAKAQAELAKEIKQASKAKQKAQRGAKSARRKETAAARASRMIPKQRLDTLPGYPPIPPPPPGPLLGRRKGSTKSRLEVPSDWRPPMKGIRDPGWYYYPAIPGGYKFQANPSANPKPKAKKKAKAKKVGMITKYGRKIPFVGTTLFGAKAKKGKRNPSFSAGELAKIAMAAGGGFVGGGIVAGTASGVVNNFVGNQMASGLLGGGATVLGAHMLMKDSDYYVPVMSGVVISALRLMFSKDYEPTPFGDVFGELKERSTEAAAQVSGLFKSETTEKATADTTNGEAMSGLPSDMELLASIDAELSEYVSVPMEEYVDVPLSEYVSVPMEEYVDVPLSGDYDGLAGSWQANDPTLSGMGQEYISMMDGYEELADAQDYDLAQEYGTSVPGVGYGELSQAEYDDFAQPMTGYEELADMDFSDPDLDDEDVIEGYEELADYADIAKHFRAIAEECESMAHAVPGAAQAGGTFQNIADAIKRRRGRAPVPRIIRSREVTLRSEGQRAWMGKLAANIKQDQGVAADFRAQVQRAILNTTQNTAFATGSEEHFRATFVEFRRLMGGKLTGGMRRAFLVAYRAATKGAKAAACAAQTAGVPAQVAQAIAQRPVMNRTQIAEDGGTPSDHIHRVGQSLVRRIQKTQPRYGKIRKAGEGTREFGGIFASSLFGRRGRWER